MAENNDISITIENEKKEEQESIKNSGQGVKKGVIFRCFLSL